jgi:hypothetical protein
LCLLSAFSWKAGALDVRQFTLNDSTPFVEVPFSVASASLVTLSARAVSGDLDPLLYVLDANGNIIAEHDDISPDDKNARLEALPMPVGNYTLVVTRFGVLKGDTSGDVAVSIALAPPDDVRPTFDVSAQTLQAMGFPTLSADRPRKAWTLLAYMSGDSNLEGALLRDLDELERGGGTDDTMNVIAFLDRSPYYSTADGDWRSARVYEVLPDLSPAIDSTLITDLGALDSGSGETLAQFLVWAVQAYPAERYAISLSGHGGAWRGLMSDDQAESIIALDELAQAFALARDAAGVARFDLLVNDACLMASVEYFAVVGAFFDVSIASPDVVYDPALDFAQLATSLRQGDDARTTAQTLADAYIARESAPDAVKSAYDSVAVTDLRAMPALTQALEAFAERMNVDPARYVPLISAAYQNAYKPASAIGANETLDVGHFMAQVIALSADADALRVARDVLTALDDARLYATAAESAARFTSYYNVYFPKDARSFEPRYFLQSPLRGWGQMLRNYYNALTPRLWRAEDSLLAYHPPQAPDVRVTHYPPVIGATKTPEIGLEVRGRSLSEGAFIVDALHEDGRTERLLSVNMLTELRFENRTELINTWKSGVDAFTFKWSPFTLWQASDGTTTALTFANEVEGVVTLEAQYQDPRTPAPVMVNVAFNADSGRIQSATQRARQTFAPFTLANDGTLTLLRYIVAPNGAIKPEAGASYRVANLQMSRVTPPDGAYQLGFFVQTFGGVGGYDSVPVVVDSALTSPVTPITRPNLWTYAFTSRNVAYPVPSDWLRPSNDALYRAPDDPNTFARLQESRDTRPVADLLQDLLIGTNASAQRPYYGEFYTWLSAPYTRTAGGIARVGRVYATRLDGITYAWTFETRDDERASMRFREAFEPMLDGFAPPLTATLSSNDVQPALIKTALVLAQTACANAPSASVCVGEGTASLTYRPPTISALPKGARAKLRPLATLAPVGDAQPTEGLASVAVGVGDDGTLDPFSVAVVRVQAGLPNYDGGVQIVAFGGVVLVNDAVDNPVPSFAWNATGGRVNVRQAPSPSAPVLASLASGEGVNAVGVNSAGDWVRVWLADRRTGWVARALLAGNGLDALPVVADDAPYFLPMAQLRFLLAGDLTDARLLNGVLFIAPRGGGDVTLNINGDNVTLAEGAVVFWQADGTSVLDTDEGEVGLFATRKPSRANFSVLKGALRLVRAGETYTAIAGTSLNVADDATTSLSLMTDSTQTLARKILNGLPDVLLPAPRAESDLQTLEEAQGLLNRTSLEDVAGLEAQTSLDVASLLPPAPTATPTAPVVDLPLSRCDEGGAWFALCNDPNPDVRDWYYRSAWILQQYEAGNIPLSDVPSDLLGLLVSAPPAEAPPAPTSAPTPPPDYIDTVQPFTCREGSGGTGIFELVSSTATISFLDAYVLLPPPSGTLTVDSFLFAGNTITITLSCTAVPVPATFVIAFSVIDSNGVTYNREEFGITLLP